MSNVIPSIRAEIKQTLPFSSLQQEALVALLRTTDVLQRYLTRVVEPFGITLQQYNVLRILRGARQALPTMEIGERMIEQAPGVTRMLDRLEQKGLIRRERLASDRRQVLCAITEAGTDIVNRLDEPMDTADAASMAALGEADLHDLVRMLDVVRAACADALPPTQATS